MSDEIDYGVSILPCPVHHSSATAGDFLAAFRDPRAVQAFQHANPRLQACLIEAGISPSVVDDGTPDGYFADRDRHVQAHLRACIVDVLESELDDSDFDDPVFDTRAFLSKLGQAKAYGAVMVVNPETPAGTPGMTTKVLAKVNQTKSWLSSHVSPMAGALGVLAGCGFLIGGIL